MARLTARHRPPRSISPRQQPAGARQCGRVCLLYRACEPDDVVGRHDGQRRRRPDPRVGNGVDHGRHFFAGDGLAATTAGTGITANYNASTGVLSLTGSDTLVHDQQVLDSVSYSSTSQNPTNSGADLSRTIPWQVSDGTLNSATQTTTVNITAVNDRRCSAMWRRLPLIRAGEPDDIVGRHDGQRRRRPEPRVGNGVDHGGHSLPAMGWRRRRRGTSITANYNASTGVLSLTGSDTWRITSRCSTASATRRPARTRPTLAPI